MKMKLIAAATLVVAFAVPAFAANEYYLVRIRRRRSVQSWRPSPRSVQ